MRTEIHPHTRNILEHVADVWLMTRLFDAKELAVVAERIRRKVWDSCTLIGPLYDTTIDGSKDLTAAWVLGSSAAVDVIF